MPKVWFTKELQIERGGEFRTFMLGAVAAFFDSSSVKLSIIELYNGREFLSYIIHICINCR